MMYDAVKVVCDELDSHLKRSSEREVLSGSILGSVGSTTIDVVDKIVISLVNIEQDTHRGHNLPHTRSMSDQVHHAVPPLSLNLFLLVSASFSSYPDALKSLSATAAFFHSNAVMTRESIPTIPKGIERLSLELENLSTGDLNNLWGIMGGKHHPCLYYKLRVLTIHNQILISEDPEVTGLNLEVGP